MDRRITACSRFLNDNLGITKIQLLLKTCEEISDATPICRDEMIRLITCHQILIYRKREKEQMRKGSLGSCLRYDTALQNLFEIIPLPLLSPCELCISSSGYWTCRMLPCIEIAEEVVVLNIDVIEKMWKEFIGVNLTVENCLLEEIPILTVENAVIRIPSAEGKSKFLRRLGIRRIPAGVGGNQ